MPTIIQNHPDFLLIYKEPGVAFHQGPNGPGLATKVRELYDAEIFPVHRLDAMTSGLILFAKSKAAARQFSEMFQAKKISKFYVALAAKQPKKKQGSIIGDMSRSRRGSWKLCHTKENPAITQFFSTSLKPGIRLYILKPLTGKTHQLRVAMKSLGTAVLGDLAYGKESSIETDRGYLHAVALKFVWNQENFEFCQLPTEGIHFTDSQFEEKFSKFLPPWDLPWPKVKA